MTGNSTEKNKSEDIESTPERIADEGGSSSRDDSPFAIKDQPEQRKPPPRPTRRPFRIQPADPEPPHITAKSDLQSKLEKLDTPGAANNPDAVKEFTVIKEKLDSEGPGGPTAASLRFPGLGPTKTFSAPHKDAQSHAHNCDHQTDEPNSHEDEPKPEAEGTKTSEIVQEPSTRAPETPEHTEITNDIESTLSHTGFETSTATKDDARPEGQPKPESISKAEASSEPIESNERRGSVPDLASDAAAEKKNLKSSDSEKFKSSIFNEQPSTSHADDSEQNDIENNATAKEVDPVNQEEPREQETTKGPEATEELDEPSSRKSKELTPAGMLQRAIRDMDSLKSKSHDIGEMAPESKEKLEEPPIANKDEIAGSTKPESEPIESGKKVEAESPLAKELQSSVPSVGAKSAQQPVEQKIQSGMAHKPDAEPSTTSETLEATKEARKSSSDSDDAKLAKDIALAEETKAATETKRVEETKLAEVAEETRPSAKDIFADEEVDPKNSEAKAPPPRPTKRPERPLAPKPKSALTSRFEQALLESEAPKPKLAPKPKPRLSGSGVGGRAGAFQNSMFADLNAALSRGPPLGGRPRFSSQEAEHKTSEGSVSSHEGGDNDEALSERADTNDSADSQIQAMPSLRKPRVGGSGRQKRLPQTAKPKLSIIAPREPLWEIIAGTEHRHSTADSDVASIVSSSSERSESLHSIGMRTETNLRDALVRSLSRSSQTTSADSNITVDLAPDEVPSEAVASDDIASTKGLTDADPLDADNMYTPTERPTKPEHKADVSNLGLPSLGSLIDRVPSPGLQIDAEKTKPGSQATEDAIASILKGDSQSTVSTPSAETLGVNLAHYLDKSPQGASPLAKISAMNDTDSYFGNASTGAEPDESTTQDAGMDVTPTKAKPEPVKRDNVDAEPAEEESQKTPEAKAPSEASASDSKNSSDTTFKLE